jgi:hypothetical protein
VGRLEHEAPPAIKVDGELPDTVALQGMRAPGSEVTHSGGSSQVSETSSQLSGPLVAETLLLQALG